MPRKKALATSPRTPSRRLKSSPSASPASRSQKKITSFLLVGQKKDNNNIEEKEDIEESESGFKWSTPLRSSKRKRSPVKKVEIKMQDKKDKKEDNLKIEKENKKKRKGKKRKKKKEGLTFSLDSMLEEKMRNEKEKELSPYDDIMDSLQSIGDSFDAEHGGRWQIENLCSKTPEPDEDVEEKISYKECIMTSNHFLDSHLVIPPSCDELEEKDTNLPRFLEMINEGPSAEAEFVCGGWVQLIVQRNCQNGIRASDKLMEWLFDLMVYSPETRLRISAFRALFPKGERLSPFIFGTSHIGHQVPLWSPSFQYLMKVFSDFGIATDPSQESVDSCSDHSFPSSHFGLFLTFLVHSLLSKPFPPKQLEDLVVLLCRFSLDPHSKDSRVLLQTSIAAALDCFAQEQWESAVAKLCKRLIAPHVIHHPHSLSLLCRELRAASARFRHISSRIIYLLYRFSITALEVKIFETSPWPEDQLIKSLSKAVTEFPIGKYTDYYLIEAMVYLLNEVLTYFLFIGQHKALIPFCDAIKSLNSKVVDPHGYDKVRTQVKDATTDLMTKTELHLGKGKTFSQIESPLQQFLVPRGK